MYRRIPRRLPLTAATACILAAGALAQNPDGPYWNEYPVPAGMTTYTVLGSVVALEAPGAVHLYSGQLRKWTVQPVGKSPTLSLTNSYCIIEDGQQIHGYSSRTGAVDTLSVSANAKLSVGSLTSSWVAVVIDGTTMWGWSGFRGHWVKQRLAGTAATIDLGSYVAAVTDGTNAYGWSAFHGSWVVKKIRTTNARYAFRSGALLGQTGPDEVLGFSSYTNTWSSMAWTGAATAVAELQDGYAMLQAGRDFLAFDALHGSLSRRVEPAVPQVLAARNVCVLTSTARTSCYAPGTGSWTQTPAVVPASNIQIGGKSLAVCALLDTGTKYLAFSGITGRLTEAPNHAPYSFALGDTAIFAGGKQSYAYSAIQDKWVATPSPAPQLITVNPMFNGIVLETKSGYDGFSARLAKWASNPATGGTLVTQTSGALTLVAFKNRIDAFDSVLGRWTSQQIIGTPNVGGRSIWRLTAIATDNVRAYGYSLFHNTWESVVLKGTYSTHRANSSIGFALTSSHVYVFTANGSLSNDSRFAEFSRFAVRGQPFRYLQTGQPGTFAVGLFGITHKEIDAGPFGTLWMDPSTMITVPLTTIPASGALDLYFDVPADPSLAGRTILMQSILIPKQGQPWLSNAMRPIFL